MEYEGGQHQEERGQYLSDLTRYKACRDAGQRYLQVTRESLVRPRRLVNEVYLEIVKGGYDGPAPRYGERWDLLFLPLTVVVGPGERRAVS